MFHISHRWKQLTKSCPIPFPDDSRIIHTSDGKYEIGTINYSNKYNIKYIQICTKCNTLMKCKKCGSYNIKDECAYGSDSDYVCQDCKLREKEYWDKKTDELIPCPESSVNINPMEHRQ